MKYLFIIFCSTISLQAQYYSQYGQDRYVLQNLFKPGLTGFFFDIGAHDGKRLSNTLAMEQRGWRGICVEPLPDVFVELQKNRHCICLQGCIAQKSGTADFLAITTRSPEISDWQYYNMLSGLLDHYDPRHLQRISNEMQQINGITTVIKVNCFTFNDVCAQYDIHHIDYLSIDTEGNEFSIIKSIDFDVYDIDVIDIENNYNDPSIKEYLENNGFVFVTRIECDEIYRNKKYLKSS